MIRFYKISFNIQEILAHLNGPGVALSTGKNAKNKACKSFVSVEHAFWGETAHKQATGKAGLSVKFHREKEGEAEEEGGGQRTG